MSPLGDGREILTLLHRPQYEHPGRDRGVGRQDDGGEERGEVGGEGEVIIYNL